MEKKSILTHLPHQDFTRKTTLTFSPRTETFKITRPSFPSTSTSTSTPDPPSSNLISSTPEIAPHTLFTTKTPTNDNGIEHIETEPLTVHAFRDSSVLEVFLNGGRTAISTRLYAAEENLGMRFFVEEDDEENAELRDRDRDEASKSGLIHAKIWDGIGA